MRILTISIIMCVYFCSISYAENQTSKEDLLYNTINNRNDSISICKKDKGLIRLLENQVDDYNQLIEILSYDRDYWYEYSDSLYNANDSLTTVLNSIGFAFIPDSTIFNSPLPNRSSIPQSLTPHYDLINNVISIKNKIDTVNSKITETLSYGKKMGLNSLQIERNIKDIISKDLNEVYFSLKELKTVEKPTFTPQQNEYVEKLILTYNEINNKYFPE